MKFCDNCGNANPIDERECQRCGALFGGGGAAEGGMGPGARVGDDRYEIVSHLGKGGMGSVYLAQDLRLDRQVAVKVLNEDLLGHQSARARMEREALIYAPGRWGPGASWPGRKRAPSRAAEA